MRFVVSCLFILVAVTALHQCQGEDIFKKLAEDIKRAADKFAHDVDHVAKDFGRDVDHAVKDFKHDVSRIWHKAEPYLKTAGVVVEGVLKNAAEVAEVGELFMFLDEADE